MPGTTSFTLARSSTYSTSGRWGRTRYQWYIFRRSAYVCHLVLCMTKECALGNCAVTFCQYRYDEGEIRFPKLRINYVLCEWALSSSLAVQVGTSEGCMLFGFLAISYQYCSSENFTPPWFGPNFRSTRGSLAVLVLIKYGTDCV